MPKANRSLLVLLTLFLFAPLHAAKWQYDNVERIVAMSDVHGAFGPMVRTLENAGIIDESMSWVGGKANLVIVGDLLDRGPESRKAMDLLMRLEGEAAAAGGRVHVLIGNHEAMNLNGDLRYVAKEEYAAFADDETAEERERWLTAYAARAGRSVNAKLQEEFDGQFPAGYFAHRRAFASDGKYGAWLLQKPIIVVINKTAFVHGGLSPMIAEIGLEGVNGKLHADLVDYVRTVELLQNAGLLLPTDSPGERLDILEAKGAGTNLPSGTAAALQNLRTLDQSPLNASDGPLWYRGNVYCEAMVEQDRLARSLQAIGARRVVIGHTPTPDREVMSRLNGMVLEVDTGMLGNYYGGMGHALVLEGDSVRVISEASPESLAPEPHPRRVGVRPGGALSVADLEHLLQHGELGALQEDDAGRDVVAVSDGKRTVNAIFTKRTDRGVYQDVAAYRLDRLLNLNMVPVAVQRKVDGKDGSLQFLPDEVMDEAQRTATGSGGRAYCPLSEQWVAMYTYDALIYNEGRSQQRMLYSTDNWQLMLIGHERAFSSRDGRPKHLEKAPIAVNNAWREALRKLDDEMLKRELGDSTTARQRKALLERRDELLEGN